MELADQKALILNQKYGDNEYVATTMRELEQLRSQATNYGLITSIAVFGLNEVARLTLRSRKSNTPVTQIASCLTSIFPYSYFQTQGPECCLLCSCPNSSIEVLLQPVNRGESGEHVAHPREQREARPQRHRKQVWDLSR